MATDESQSESRSGPGWSARGLLAVNGLLLALLGLVTFGPAADAQLRARGEYTMAAGRVNGSDGKAVYIIDAVNQEMVVVTYNPNTRQLEGIGYRNLAADAADVVRAATRANN